MISEEFSERRIVRELEISSQDRKSIVNYMKMHGYTPSIAVTYELNKLSNSENPRNEYCSVSDIKYIEEKITSIPNMRNAYLEGKLKVLYYEKEEALGFVLSFNRWCADYAVKANFSEEYLNKVREKFYSVQNPEGYQMYGFFRWWPLNIQRECVNQFLETHRNNTAKKMPLS